MFDEYIYKKLLHAPSSTSQIYATNLYRSPIVPFCLFLKNSYLKKKRKKVLNCV